MNAFERIELVREKKGYCIFSLIDPDLKNDPHLTEIIKKSNNKFFDGILVGGSSIEDDKFEFIQSIISNDTRVAGVISEDPAYLMNDKSDGQAIALVGKVKCKVKGIIQKGDLLTTSGEQPGYAKKAMSPVLGSIIGKAMENKDSADESTILISVGRL